MVSVDAPSYWLLRLLRLSACLIAGITRVDVGDVPSGSVLVADPANPDQPATAVDRIKIANWQGSPIVKGTDGLFRVRGGGVLPADEEARVQTGAVEESNVDVTRILVEMVQAQRLFDMRTKLVATAKELDEGGASLMRL